MLLFVLIFILFIILGYNYYYKNITEPFQGFVDQNELSQEARQLLGEKIRMGSDEKKLNFNPVETISVIDDKISKEIDEKNKKSDADKPKNTDTKTNTSTTNSKPDTTNATPTVTQTSSSSNTNTSSKPDIDLTQYIPKSELSKYILKTQVPSMNNVDMSKYILKTQIPNIPTDLDISKYILKTEVPKTTNTVDLSDYVLKTDINKSDNKVDMSKYILKTDINNSDDKVDMSKYILKTDVNSNNEVDMSKYMLKTDIKECTKPNKSVSDIKPDKPVNDTIHANDIRPPENILSNVNFQMPMPPFNYASVPIQLNRPSIANFIFPTDNISVSPSLGEPNNTVSQQPVEPQKQCVLTRRMFMGPDIYGAY